MNIDVIGNPVLKRTKTGYNYQSPDIFFDNEYSLDFFLPHEWSEAVQPRYENNILNFKRTY